MEEITSFVLIVIIVFGILQIILFFKLWGMTNNVKKIRESFLTGADGLSPAKIEFAIGNIEKAKELISTNTMKLSDVASMVGFSDSLYFSRVFKKTTGIPPKEYQQSLLTANTPNWWPDK